MWFKNYWTDLLEIVIESVKVYTHCVCEISQQSKSNCVFENQEIEITYKNYSSFNTWATLMKQKVDYGQYVEQEQDIFRYVKNSELTREIMCHLDWIFPHLHPPSRFELCFVSSHFASVWEFSKMLLLNFGMSAISDCPFITCQNLHFGKYVGLTVCYLPKVTFWQVCWFNGLSVCPSLYKITDNSRNLWDIFTKISQQMSLGCSSIAFSFQGQTSKVKVTRSLQKSKLEIAVTPLIFELQQNLKNHNVVLLKSHHYDIINFRYHFRFKRSSEVETGNAKLQFLFSSVFNIAQIWLHI